jgi:hypothetical protein
VFERGKALKHTTRFPLVAYIVEYFLSIRPISCFAENSVFATLRPINHTFRSPCPSRKRRSEVHSVFPSDPAASRPHPNSRRVDSARHRLSNQGNDSKGWPHSPLGAESQKWTVDICELYCFERRCTTPSLIGLSSHEDPIFPGFRYSLYRIESSPMSPKLRTWPRTLF